MTRWIKIHSPRPEPPTREERPKRRCPNCGKNRVYKVQEWKTQPWIVWRWLGVFDEKDESELGWQTVSNYCHNCGYDPDEDGE